MMPEVAVGRAPASTAAEATNFVNKTIQYETTADPNYSTVVLAGEQMDSATWGSSSMEAIRTQTLPGDWNFETFYDTPSYTCTGGAVDLRS